MNQPPAFQFYVDNFIEGTSDMSPHEVGCYIRLLCHQWSRGQIPIGDVQKLRRVCGGVVSDEILQKFPDGKNARLELERGKQQVWREKSSKGGLKGAATRASRVVQPPLQSPLQPKGQPNGNTPSPSPSPNNTSEVFPSPFPIPSSLNRKDFVKIWENWLEHLKQKRKQPTILAGEMQLKKLESMGIERAMAALKFSIEGNYQGIFEPNPRQQNTEQHKPISKMTSAEMVSEAMR